MDKFSTMEGKSQIVICLNGPVDERLFVCPGHRQFENEILFISKNDHLIATKRAGFRQMQISYLLFDRISIQR